MKKIINKPDDVVEEMIQGVLVSHPNLARLEGYNVLVRADAKEFQQKNIVALISGGGSGHEPSHAGFIGDGMLSAAVLGAVFSSPSPQQVYQAIKHVTGPSGALLIVKNYTGDRLNFGLAQEMARADGLKVEIVIVDDDVALKTSKRGLAGTVLVHKVAGAMANSGASLEHVKQVAMKVINQVGTMGVGLGPCIIPSAGKPSFTLGDNEIELGLGIHGEPGVKKQEMVPANDLVKQMLDMLKNQLNLSKEQTPRVCSLINGLGATPLMELYIVSQAVSSQLSSIGIQTERVIVGNLMSSLEMPGMSITILPIDDELCSLIDANTNAPGWPRVGTNRIHSATISVPQPSKQLQSESSLTADSFTFKIIQNVCKMLIEKKDFLTELDRAVGDGDLGISLSRGAQGVLDLLPTLSSDMSDALHAIGLCVQEQIAGSSGPLYAIFFLSTARYLKTISQPSLSDWATALKTGADEISFLGGASVGDCTMLDALYPAIEAIQANVDQGFESAKKAAASAAREGANSTISMVPACGRGQYLGERAKDHIDGGAEAVALIFECLSSQFE